MHSCLYSGFVRHQRSKPVKHGFRYPLFFAYLDLSELGSLQQACSLLKCRFGPANFRLQDHPIAAAARHDDVRSDPTSSASAGSKSLDESIRQLVAQRSGWRPDGPIRLLTLLRSWGYYFSPLNLYFCFSCEQDGPSQDSPLQAMVAEVSNTPWRETNYYILSDLSTLSKVTHGRLGLRTEHAKTFHVSPFMDMDSRYEWHLSVPSTTLDLKLICDNPKHPFVADLQLNRRPLSNQSLAKLLIRHPWMPGQIIGRIYYQALKLWWKRCPFYPHPNHNAPNQTRLRDNLNTEIPLVTDSVIDR